MGHRRKVLVERRGRTLHSGPIHRTQRDPPDEEHERSLEECLGSHEPVENREDKYWYIIRRNHSQPLTQSGRELGQKCHRSSGKCCSRHEAQTAPWAEGIEWRWELELGLMWVSDV